MEALEGIEIANQMCLSKGPEVLRELGHCKFVAMLECSADSRMRRVAGRLGAQSPIPSIEY